VVDDDPETLDLHARIVQAHSPRNHVLRAHSGRAALAILGRVHVDLVLLDLAMPELDGYSVLEAMRSRPETRATPVIVMTGQVLDEAQMARLNQGVTAVMGKGLYNLEETLAHLEGALTHARKLNREAQRLVRKAMAFVHAHYAEPLTRGDIARHVGLDADYLTLCFRQELGMTPITYLNRCRIHQAKQLLKQTDASVTAIALQVGFSDSGYFSRVFRREAGLSPDAFRRG
jgi:YesN/AraC family two-component response regulator